MKGEIYTGLARVYADLKQYDDALAAAKKGVELAANVQNSYGALGDVHAARKEYDQAIDAYRKAVEVGPLQIAAVQGSRRGMWGNPYPRRSTAKCARP